MKILTMALLALFTSTFTDLEQLKVGEKARGTDLKMTDLNGSSVSLNDLKMENGVCVIFSCNTCPWVIAWEDRYNELNKVCKENKIGFVLVNSNEAKREGDDSLEQMKAHAKEKGYSDLAYVVDKDHALADAFGATKTPDVFLFNGNMELVYKGAIDDNSKDKAAVEEAYLTKAVKSLVSGVTIDPAETKALGCSIKRNS